MSGLTTTTKLCELYMAKNIDALYSIAVENEEAKKLRGKKLDALYKAADKLYKSITDEIADEEKTYIYIIRFLKLTEYVSNTDCDKKFFDLRFGPSVTKAKTLLSTIRSNLIIRYARLSDTTKIIDSGRSNIIQPEAPKSIFGADIFITSKELFDAFMAKYNILIMDTRASAAYNESHLKEFLSINIAEECIAPGLSAHILGSKFTSDVKMLYDRRDTFEYIVLLDWDTTSKTLLSSKLQTLRTILTEWDVNKNYKHPPYILNGGYMDFIDMYPTFSTNPRVIYNQKYSELDDLLDLDMIQYPTEGLTPFIQIAKPSKPERNAQEIMDQMGNIISKQFKIELDLLNNQTKLYDMEKKMGVTFDNSEMNQLIEARQNLEGEIAELETAKIITDERKNILTKQLQPLLAQDNDRDMGILGKKKLDIEKSESKIAETVRKRKKLIEEHEKSIIITNIMEAKPKLSDEAEVKPSGDDNKAVTLQHSKPKPVVNRKTKPSNIVNNAVQSTGLTGIVNIRNTCYMNTIIQCFRHIPLVKDFFCKGIYNECVSNKREPVIIYEMAQLIRSLWSGSYTYIRPSQFYNKIGQLNPLFQEGHHEDCMEFFLMLLNTLNEDCSIDVTPKDKYISAKHEAWFYRLSKKTSFFVDNFYHQVRVSFICTLCSKKCQKFELENTFMLSVPGNKDFYIDELLERYLSVRDMVPFYCSKCEVEVKLSKEISYQPKVIVIVLKRYMFEGGVIQRKNNACHFPLDNFKIGRAMYKLWSIAMHQGTMQSGHYTAACLNPVDGRWYEYNDEVVNQMDINSSYVKVRAYLLFYQIVDGEKNFGFDKL